MLESCPGKSRIRHRCILEVLAVAIKQANKEKKNVNFEMEEMKSVFICK